MAPSAVNEARRELAQLRNMIDEARRDLGIEAPKPAQIAAKRFRSPRSSRKAARKTTAA